MELDVRSSNLVSDLLCARVFVPKNGFEYFFWKLGILSADCAHYMSRKAMLSAAQNWSQIFSARLRSRVRGRTKSHFALETAPLRSILGFSDILFVGSHLVGNILFDHIVSISKNSRPRPPKPSSGGHFWWFQICNSFHFSWSGTYSFRKSATIWSEWRKNRPYTLETISRMSISGYPNLPSELPVALGNMEFQKVGHHMVWVTKKSTIYPRNHL